MTAAVHRLAGDEWVTLRAARLAALADAPEAFRTTLAEATAFDETTWRAQLDAQAWFVAEAARVVGIAAGGPHRGGDPQVRVLRAMWVAPPERGQGTAAALVDAVCRWARGDGATRLTCWALEAVPRARAFYRRYGFVEVEPFAVHADGAPPMARYELTL